MKKLDIALIITLFLFLLFHLQMMRLYETTGTMPESYAIAVTGALLGEAGICGWIRTAKVRAKPPDDEPEDGQEGVG